MKTTMTVHGWSEGKEFRQDLPMPSISMAEFEIERSKSQMLFESMRIQDAASIKPTPNFVRVWKWYLPETEDEQKYFFGLFKNV